MRKLFIVALLFLGFGAAARAQYTDRQAIEDLGGPQEFAARRAELMAQARTGYTLLFARNDIPEATHYREDNDFYYYTGVQDPGAVLAMDNASGKIILFEPQQVGRTAQTYGANLLSQPEEAKKLGFDTVQPVGNLDIWLSYALSVHPQVDLWVRLGFPDKADGARGEVGRDHAWKFAHPYHEDVPQDLAPGKLLARTLSDGQAARRHPDHRCDAQHQAAAKKLKSCAATERSARRATAQQSPTRGRECTSTKSKRALTNISTATERRAWRTWRLSAPEKTSTPGTIFPTATSSKANQLVVFDYGASLDHMTMDITRTFNISGKFTPEQAKWYAVDLESQKATIALLKPGHTYEEAEAAGKAVFEKAGIGDQWYGWPGHFVGLATHDVMHPSGPIKAGQVITVEPIVEFLDKQMHFRVEDTVLITNGEPEILSAAIPKEIADVEKLVGSEAKEK